MSGSLGVFAINNAVTGMMSHQVSTIRFSSVVHLEGGATPEFWIVSVSIVSLDAENGCTTIFFRQQLVIILWYQNVSTEIFTGFVDLLLNTFRFLCFH